MHPLSVFPQLLTFGLISPFLLRLAAGFFIIYVAKARFKKPYNWLAFVYGFFAALLILGIYTQVAALVAIIIVKSEIWIMKKNFTPSKEIFILYGLVTIILISLLFTGPGLFAFDLPL